jgi:hypothetical protein
MLAVMLWWWEKESLCGAALVADDPIRSPVYADAQQAV